MAMIRVAPVDVQVRTDWFNGLPREITWGAERLPITRVVAVRDERSAYPAITGPRTLFEVDTAAYRLALDLPPPLAPLDYRGPGRGRQGGLTPPHSGSRLLPVGPGSAAGRARERSPRGPCPSAAIAARWSGPRIGRSAVGSGPSLQSVRGYRASASGT